jgi:glycine oxidase
MSTGTDVVVLGGGVAGCATAYFLARSGASVRVVERDAVGSCASGYALGLLNPLTGTGIPGPMAPFADAAFKLHKELWPVLREESGTDFQVHLTPHLELYHTPEEANDHEAERALWSEASGFHTEWIDAADVRRLEPRVTRDLYGAVLLEDVGVLDSYRYTLALWQAAEHHGATFVAGEAVGLKSAGGRVTGVRLSNREIDCDTVVVALGPWSGQCSEWLGLDIPVEPLKGQMIYLEGFDPPLRHHIHGPSSLVQKVDGMVWMGATLETAGFDLEETEEARDYLMERALTMVPGLEDQKLVRQTACLRPVTPDHQPILGKVPGWEGVYLATGAEKKGILISPGIGRAVADLVLTGETSLPIDPFAPERFAKTDAAAPADSGD